MLLIGLVVLVDLTICNIVEYKKDFKTGLFKPKKISIVNIAIKGKIKLILFVNYITFKTTRMAKFTKPKTLK